MASDNEINQLKAQVNRFKRGVESFNKTGSMNELLSAYIETPEQCLSKVKAKAIEGYRRQIAESKQIDMATKIMTISV